MRSDDDAAALDAAVENAAVVMPCDWCGPEEKVCAENTLDMGMLGGVPMKSFARLSSLPEDGLLNHCVSPVSRSPTEEPLEEVLWKRPGASNWLMLLSDAMERRPDFDSSACFSKAGLMWFDGGEADRAREWAPKRLESEPPLLVLPRLSVWATKPAPCVYELLWGTWRPEDSCGDCEEVRRGGTSSKDDLRP